MILKHDDDDKSRGRKGDQVSICMFASRVRKSEEEGGGRKRKREMGKEEGRKEGRRASSPRRLQLLYHRFSQRSRDLELKIFSKVENCS